MYIFEYLNINNQIIFDENIHEENVQSQVTLSESDEDFSVAEDLFSPVEDYEPSCSQQQLPSFSQNVSLQEIDMQRDNSFSRKRSAFIDGYLFFTITEKSLNIAI